MSSKSRACRVLGTVHFDKTDTKGFTANFLRNSIRGFRNNDTSNIFRSLVKDNVPPFPPFGDLYGP